MSKERFIFKYELPFEGIVCIQLPKYTQVLTVVIQQGRLYIWALVDPDEKTEQKTFRIAGTGNLIRGNWKFIGTIFIETQVFHVFEAEV